MRKLFIVVIIVFTTVMQVYSQVPNETNVTKQDTTGNVVTEQKKHTVTSTKPDKNKNPMVKEKKNGKESNNQPTNNVNDSVSEPNQNWFQNFWNGLVGKNDCKQCETKLKKANIENTRLKNQMNSWEKKLGKTKAILDIDDRDFYRSLITTPLTKKYDTIQVDCYKKTISMFDHENKKEMKWVYEIYYPLLENYWKYNHDLERLIQRVIRSFDLLAVPDINNEKELFNDGLQKMEYYKEYRYKSNISQEIKYLEDVINDTKSLFEDSSRFTKENFEKQLRRLK